MTKAIVVKLMNAERVLDGQVGMTFIVDKFSPSQSGGKVAHVRDYRPNVVSPGARPFQIWSLPPDHYTIIETVDTDVLMEQNAVLTSALRQVALLTQSNVTMALSRDSALVLLARLGKAVDEALEEAAHLVQVDRVTSLRSALSDCVESLKRLPDVDGAYRVTCITEAEKALAGDKSKLSTLDMLAELQLATSFTFDDPTHGAWQRRVTTLLAGGAL